MDKAEKTNVKAVKTKPVTPKKPKVAKSLQKQKAKMGWLFIAPFLVGFFLLYLPMIYESIKFSFCDMTIKGGGGFDLTFVGWKNYSDAWLVDNQFRSLLFGSIGELFLNVPAIVIFSLFIAVLLNQKMKGRAVFRAIFFIPVIVSTGIIESIDIQNTLAETMETINTGVNGMQSTNTGSEIISMIDVSRYLSSMQVGKDLVKYIVELVNSVYQIVNKSGVQMLIFLAGLQSISPAIYESCHIDGASSWETFWKITFPMISPMILVNAVYTIIDSFTSKSNSVMNYISEVYNQAGGGNVRSTAMSWMYFLVVIVILALIAGLLSAYVFYQKRDA